MRSRHLSKKRMARLKRMSDYIYSSPNMVDYLDISEIFGIGVAQARKDLTYLIYKKPDLIQKIFHISVK